MKKALHMLVCAAVAAGMAFSSSAAVYADIRSEVRTSVVKDITDLGGQYTHWDGVSPIAQFKYSDGSFCLAVDGTDEITIVKTAADGSVVSDDLKLKKAHSVFGTVVCDANGYFYAVTGEVNETSDTSKQTVFISKYLPSGGEPMMTVGNNGSSSLQSYHGSGYNTKIPFDSGVSAAIADNVMAVHYGREMYNGHQANSVWIININTFMTMKDTAWISSHSFAHRTIPFGYKSFLFLSEGDANERAFSTYAVEVGSLGVINYKKGYTFHFWIEKDAYKNEKWGVINNNFAHLAGIVSLGNGTAALVGTAAPSLTSDAASEREQLFVQIFDPYADLSQESAYVTKGTRSGLSGPNGDKQVTNYGVKWLLDYTDSTIENPQVVGTDDGRIVVLFERGDRKAWVWGWAYNRYDGLYYMILDQYGNVVKPATLFSKTARLNPCTMPVYIDGSIYWAGNTISNNRDVNINVLRLTDEEDNEPIDDSGNNGGSNDNEGGDQWDSGSSGDDGNNGNNGNDNDNNGSDNSGNTGTGVLKGDADGDGTVDVFDAALILAYIGNEEYVTIDQDAADVNGDGIISREDAELIMRYAAGNTDLF
ncbi:MAG: dockerin type I repeat-containing protein [Oscillospiraceae bacterium]|nr:dockerin type I repeat-containing protein [Oscillospiraceae bacterium]